LMKLGGQFGNVANISNGNQCNYYFEPYFAW
jgi:hypothetical protein